MTGVQTCALPICGLPILRPDGEIILRPDDETIFNSMDDACLGNGFDTSQVTWDPTWDPGGSTQHRLEDETVEWVQYALPTPWDPRWRY